MIRLKNILNELEVRKGHFGKEKSFDLFDDFLFEDKVVTKSDANKISDYVSTISANKKESQTLLPKEFQQTLIRAGQVVYKSGTLYVIKKDTGKESVVYAMYDFSKPAYNALFFIGRLLTEFFRSNLPLSPQKQFKLDRVEKINLSQLGSEHLGQGFGSILYDSAIKTTDALYSDTILYGGSFKVWVKHMKNKSKFFGVYSGNRKIILPIYTDDGLEKAKLKSLDDSSGFVAITKSVPSQLLKLQQFLDGIDPHNLVEIEANSRLGAADMLKSIVDKIDSSTDTLDLINSRDPSDKVFFFTPKRKSPFEAGYILAKNATIFVRENGGSLDMFLL